MRPGGESGGVGGKSFVSKITGALNPLVWLPLDEVQKIRTGLGHWLFGISMLVSPAAHWPNQAG